MRFCWQAWMPPVSEPSVTAASGRDQIQALWIGMFSPGFSLKNSGIRNLVWVLAPWVFVAITFKEWILVLDG